VGIAIGIGLALLGALGGGVVEEDETPALEELVRAKEPAVRRRAVRDLAARGDREAWTLVLEALGDPKGEVADEAQFLLAGLDEARVRRALLGSKGLGSRDALLRRRVAELLGRFEGEVEMRELLGRVDRRDPRLSELLLWSVERAARRGRLGGRLARCGRDLAKLAKSGAATRVRAQAVRALGEVDPAILKEVAGKLRRDRVPEVRLALLEVLVRQEPERAIELGEAALDDGHPAVRLAALDAVAAAGLRRSLELLAGRLEHEPRFRLQVACVEHLQGLSGMKYKLDPRPWQLWISKLPVDWSVADRRRTQAVVGETASLAGLPILSDRVVFLVDFSGSLWFERDGRPPRKLQVDELMRVALPRLREGARFNVMPYTGTPHPWREHLVDATPKNVRVALADFEACTEKGSGNVFDAVLLALEDPEVDRIVILTDGAPTGGAHWKLDLMMPMLVQVARLRRVAYDAIVVDARPGLRRRWFALAEATGGRAVAVDTNSGRPDRGSR